MSMPSAPVGIEHTLGLIADLKDLSIEIIDAAADPMTLFGGIMPMIANLKQAVVDGSQMKPELGDIDPGERIQILEAAYQFVMAVLGEALAKFAPK